jgi:hypothetical protein
LGDPSLARHAETRGGSESATIKKQMPITASINRHPETENESQNAPHPEEMKATFDLAIRRCHADNPGRLGGSGIAIPGGFTCKETAGRKTSSVIAKPEGSAKKAKTHGKSVHRSHACGGNTHGR